MASKYAKLRGKIPAFELETDFRQKVQAWQVSVYGENPEDANLTELIANLEHHKNAKKILEEQVAELNIHIEALSRLIVPKMEADGIESLKLSSGASCYVSYEVYPNVFDKEAICNWARKHGLAKDLTLHPSKTKAVCSELSLDGKPMPAGVSVFLKSSARIRNGSSGDE